MFRKVPLALSLGLTVGFLPQAALAQLKPTPPSDNPVVLPEVVSKGQADAETERKTSETQKLVISEEQIERYDDATVGDVLRRLPGMTYSGPGGVASTIRMRGLGAGYTQILINGEPVTSGSANRQMSVDRIPAHMIERVEIIRNPSAEMESAGISGTVNIVLKENAEPLTRLGAAYGKNGAVDVGNAKVQMSRQFGDLSTVLGLSHTRAAEDVTDESLTYGLDGSVTERTVAPRTVAKSETLFTPRFSWKLGDGRLTLDPFATFGADTRRITSETKNAAGNVTTSSETDELRNDQIARLSSRYEHQTGWGSWYAKLGFQQGRSGSDQTVRSTNATGTLTTSNVVDAIREDQGYVGTGLAVPMGAHTLKAGLEYRDTGFDTNRKAAASTTYNIQERRAVAYLMDEWRLNDAHSLTPGLRLENFDRTAGGGTAPAANATYLIPNPSLHYRWAVSSSTNLRASYAQTLRNPSFTELSPLVTLATRANAGSVINPDTAGTPGLRPERATGFELGLEQFLWNDLGVVGLNVYQRNIHDFIEGRIGQEGSRYVQRPQNVGQARIYGAELDLRLPILRRGDNRLTLMGSHAEMRGEILTSGAPLDIVDLAPRVSTIGLDYGHVPTGWNAGFTFNQWPRFVARTEAADGARQESMRRENPLLDIYVGKALSPTTEVRFLAKNLLSVVGGGGRTTYNAGGTQTARSEKLEHTNPTFLLTIDTMF